MYNNINASLTELFMNSLTAVQKAVKVLGGLALVAVIISFAASSFALISASVVLWMDYNMHAHETAFAALLDSLIPDSVTYAGLEATLLSAFAVCLICGFVYLAVRRYLGRVLADGTPFTYGGAKTMRNLGIRVIIWSILTKVITVFIFNCLKVVPAAADYDMSDVFVGITLILFSFVLHCGTDIIASKDGNGSEH